MLKANMRVQITVEAGTVIGRIEEVQTVDEMPDLSGETGLPTVGPFAPKNIMREWGVTRVAAITYHTSSDQQLMFAALEIGGEWFDLKRQKLEIETVWV
jgi:hypothetical protein